MKQHKGLLNKEVKLKSIGKVIGGTLAMAVVTGLFWHRQAIKRLLEIRQM